jgi:hypothetical protein
VDQRTDDTAQMPPVSQEGDTAVGDAQYTGGTAGNYAASPAENVYGAAQGDPRHGPHVHHAAQPADDAYGAAPGGAYQAGGSRGGYATTSSYATRVSSSASSYATEAPSTASRYSQAPAAPRQARLAVAHVDPWSVMKFSFMISLVCFIVAFVAVTVLYGALDAIGVFAAIQHALANVTSSQGSAGVNVSSWFSASTILGYTAMFGAFDVVVITVLSTVGAGIYNLISRLVGGIEVTLREAE